MASPQTNDASTQIQAVIDVLNSTKLSLVGFQTNLSHDGALRLATDVGKAADQIQALVDQFSAEQRAFQDAKDMNP